MFYFLHARYKFTLGFFGLNHMNVLCLTIFDIQKWQFHKVPSRWMLQDPFPCLFLLVNGISGILKTIFNIDVKSSIFLLVLVLLGHNLRNPSLPWGHNVFINFLQLILQIIFLFRSITHSELVRKGLILFFSTYWDHLLSVIYWTVYPFLLIDNLLSYITFSW